MMIDDGILRQIFREESQDWPVNTFPRKMLEGLIERLDKIVDAQPNLQPVKPVFDPTEGGRGFAIGGLHFTPAIGAYELSRRSWSGTIHGTCEYEAWNHLGHSYGNGRFFCDGDVGSPPDHELMTVEDTIKRHTTGRSEQTAQEWANEVERITVASGGSFGYGQRSDDLGRPLHSPVGHYQPTDQPQAEPPHAYLQHTDTDRHRVVVDFGEDTAAADAFAAWFNDGSWDYDKQGSCLPIGPTAEQAAAMQGIDSTAGTMALPLTPQETEPDAPESYRPVTIDDIKQDPASVYHGFEGDPETEHFCKWCDASQYAEQHKHGMTGRVPLKKLQPLDEYPPPKQD